MNLKVWTLIFFASLIGSVNAMDTNRVEDSFEDLEAKLLPRISRLEEENIRLRKLLPQVPNLSLRAYVPPLSVADYDVQEGTGVEFMQKIFTDLSKRILSVVSGLERENQALEELLAQMKEQQASEHNAALKEKFTVICEYISKIPTGKNVHTMDDFVFGSQAQITNLLEIGRHIKIDNGDLSWNGIIDIINKMFKVGPNDVVAQYEEKEITLRQFQVYAKDYFDNIPTQLSVKLGAQNALCDQVRELWSRTVSLSMIENNKDLSILPLLVAMISENYLTKGYQSLGGKINRTFIRYISLIGPYVNASLSS